MAMVKSPTARSKLDPPEPIIPPQHRFQQPTIWWKGPDEYIREDQHAIRVQKYLLPHLEYGTKPQRPPPGHVRLLFWWSLEELQTTRPKAQMSADIALETDGSLDLLKVQQLWGLESVSIIHPLRWRIFETGDPNRLSAIGVHDLSIERHIFVTENPATRNTEIMRILRLLCIDLYFLSFFGLFRLVFYGGYSPKKRVPVPEWYDNTVDVRNSIVHQLKDATREMDDTYGWMLSCGNRLASFGAYQRVQYSWRREAVGEWLEYIQDHGRELAVLWGPTVLAIITFGLVWIVDTFIVRVF